MRPENPTGKNITRLVYVNVVSLNNLTDNGFDPTDKEDLEDRIFSDFERKLIYRKLTPRQAQVVKLIEDGFTDRREIARSLKPPVSVQAINQIMLRIRKRVKAAHARR